MSATGSRFAWSPTPEQAGASRLRHFIDTLGASDLDGVARLAREDPQRFWASVVDDIGVEWTRRFDVAMDTSPGLPWTQFWRGGKLNLAHNAVTRWARRAPERPAVVWEGDDGSTGEWTYADLHRQTAYAAETLSRLGVGAGRQRRPVPADDPRDGVTLPRLRVARSHRGAAVQRLRRRSDRLPAARLRRQGSGRC